MNRDNPALRWLAWPIFLLLIGPILYFGLFNRHHGVFTVLFANGISHWPWVFFLFFYVLSAWAVLRWKRLGVGIAISAAVTFAQATCADLPSSAKVVVVDFGISPSEYGIDVFCNGVHLGVTPFTMTDAEFKSRVVPWSTPPDQPAVHPDMNANGTVNKGFMNWQFTWTPSNPFDDPFAAGHSTNSFQIYHDDEKLQSYVKTARFWWRFEKNGCLALRPMWGLAGGANGGPSISKVQAALAISVQSEREMQNVVLGSLKALDYRPSPEWENFVFNYRNELLTRLITIAETDSRLSDVLDLMACHHFQLPSDADIPTSREVLDRVFNNVSQKELASYDWFAGRTALRIVKKYPQLLIEKMQLEVTSSPGSWMTDQSYSVNRRRELLFELLAEVHPRELFDLCVYLKGLQQTFFLGTQESNLLIAIGNSERPEAIRLMMKHLDDVWTKKRIGSSTMLIHDRDRQQSLRIMTQVYHPSLEANYWRIIGENITPDQFNSQTPLPQFIQSRIARSSELDAVHQIQMCKALTDSEKALFLAQCHHSNGGIRLNSVADRLGDHERAQLMDKICRLPTNPDCVEFLTSTWIRENKLRPGSVHPDWNWAILRIDSPKTEEFILERLEAGGTRENHAQWGNLTNILSVSSTDHLEHLDWLVPVLRTASLNQRLESIYLLSAIGTEGAKSLLQEWSADPKTGLGAQVKWVLDRQLETAANQNAKTLLLLAKANDLFAGRIKPDDLLPPMPSARWTGETYEPNLVAKESQQPE